MEGIRFNDLPRKINLKFTEIAIKSQKRTVQKETSRESFQQMLENELKIRNSEYNYIKNNKYLKYNQTYDKDTHNLQKHLIKLGYMDIKDLEKSSGKREFGFFGPKTTNAVMKLQKDAGIKIDGIVGPETKKALAKMLKEKGLMDIIEINVKAPLDIGSTGRGVAYIQKKLKYLGFYRGDTDGIYGPLTYRALWMFKKANGLAQYPGNNNGTADILTLNTLLQNSVEDLKPYMPEKNTVEMHLMKPAERKKYLKELAIKYSKDTGISPKLIYAVACLESSAGRYVPTMGHKISRNLFGIKDFGRSFSNYQGTNGFTINTTREFIISRAVNRSIDVTARFRAYNSYEESVMDFVSLMHSNIYRDVVVNNHNLDEISKFLEGTYSTNYNFAEKLSPYFKEYEKV